MQESEYPLVSICMPVYNGARFLPYTIDNNFGTIISEY